MNENKFKPDPRRVHGDPEKMNSGELYMALMITRKRSRKLVLIEEAIKRGWFQGVAN